MPLASGRKRPEELPNPVQYTAPPPHEELPSSEGHSAEAGNSGPTNHFIPLGGTPWLLCETKGHVCG